MLLPRDRIHARQLQTAAPITCEREYFIRRPFRLVISSYLYYINNICIPEIHQFRFESLIFWATKNLLTSKKVDNPDVLNGTLNNNAFVTDVEVSRSVYCTRDDQLRDGSCEKMRGQRSRTQVRLGWCPHGSNWLHRTKQYAISLVSKQKKLWKFQVSIYSQINKCIHL